MDRRQSLKILKELTESSDQNYQKDILFKMSKKIAQLTKVVYFLNTRNEDMEVKMKDMKAACELEINETGKDRESIIKDLNRKLAESQQRCLLQETELTVHFS